MCWSLFLAQVFSCEISEIFKNTFFHRTSPVAAFVFSKNNKVKMKKEKKNHINMFTGKRQ